MKYQKTRKKNSKIYNQLTRSEPNWLLLLQSKFNPLKISDFPAVAKRGWQMQEMFKWQQFIWVFLVLEKKLSFCVITEIMVTDTEKSRRTNRHRTRPWRSRQRVSLIILGYWVRVSLVAVQKEFFFCFISNYKNLKLLKKK